VIHLRTEYMRGYLRALQQRVQLTAEAMAWHQGDPEYIPAELLADMQEGTDAYREFVRFAKQTQNRGPMMLRLRRQAALGTVTWTDADPVMTRRLDALRLRRLAQQGMDALVVNGICAYWPVVRSTVTSRAALDQRDDARPVTEDMARPTLQHLSGHLELLWDDDDVGGTPVGLLQVTGNQRTHEGDGVLYDVRIWDFTEQRLLVWTGLEQPWMLGTDPTHTFPDDADTEAGAQLVMPTVEWIDLDQYGYPVGEGKVNLPSLRDEVSTNMRLKRASTSHAYPVWALVGDWTAVETIGAHTILRARREGSTAERVESADLLALLRERAELREDIRQAYMAPLTGSQDAPSGEAYVQANVAYYTVSDDYAQHLGLALSQPVRQYLAMLDGTTELSQTLQDFSVVVKPDLELKRATISMQVREDFRAGMTTRRMAIGELEPFYPSATSEHLEAVMSLDDPLDDDAGDPDGNERPEAFADTSDDALA
jgi:hypothetical protein